VKIILGFADINLYVSDFNFNSCLSVGDVKIGEKNDIIQFDGVLFPRNALCLRMSFWERYGSF